MEKHILIDSEVDYFEDGLITHVGLVQFLPFAVLLAVAKDVLPDLGVPVLAQLPMHLAKGPRLHLTV